MSAVKPPGYFRLFYDGNSFLRTIAVALFAFLFCFFCGQRGFFALDQSIVFDGAYRIVSGQIPFRDFVVPHSLAVLYLQAIFFLSFGVNYLSYLVCAAVMNMLAALIAARIVAALFPECRRSVLAAGVITAIWFYPPFGTPFGEQTAFLLGMLGIDCLLQGVLTASDIPGEEKRKHFFFAGVCAGLAWFCKQNVALFLLPIFVLTPWFAWFPDSRRSARCNSRVLLGILLAVAVPVLFILLAGLWKGFWYFYVLLPVATATRRLSAPDFSFAGAGSAGFFLAFAAVFFAIIFSVRRRILDALWRACAFRTLHLNTSLASWIALCILVLSALVRRSMLNSPTIADVYIGILLALIYAVVVERNVTEVSRAVRRTVNVLLLAVILFGIFLSWTRKVHESVNGSAFTEAIGVERLGWLRWGNPTMIREGNAAAEDPGADVTATDVRELITFLRAEDKNFFVFPDFTILYAVLQKPSPQPILFFHRGLTYPSDYSSDLDNWVVESLIDHQVSLVVLEDRSFFGSAQRLGDFPMVSAFLSANFVETRKIGLFRIFSLRTLDEVAQ